MGGSFQKPEKSVLVLLGLGGSHTGEALSRNPQLDRPSNYVKRRQNPLGLHSHCTHGAPLFPGVGRGRKGTQVSGKDLAERADLALVPLRGRT